MPSELVLGLAPGSSRRRARDHERGRSPRRWREAAWTPNALVRHHTVPCPLVSRTRWWTALQKSVSRTERRAHIPGSGTRRQPSGERPGPPQYGRRAAHLGSSVWRPRGWPLPRAGRPLQTGRWPPSTQPCAPPSLLPPALGRVRPRPGRNRHRDIAEEPVNPRPGERAKRTGTSCRTAAASFTVVFTDGSETTRNRSRKPRGLCPPPKL